MNIAHLLVRAARAMPDRPAIRVGQHDYCNYGQLLNSALRLAQTLRTELGCQQGDRVAIVAANCPQYVEVMWGVWLAGCVLVPVNYRLHGLEIAWILDHAEARVCFVDGETATSLEPLLEQQGQDNKLRTRCIRIDNAAFGALQTHGSCLPASMTGDLPAWLFYTSGTTGRPKGATLTHGNLLAMCLRNFADIDATAAEDCMIHVAPFSHASGLFSISHMAAGALHVIPESKGFDAGELVHLIQANRNSSIFLVPTMLNRFVGHCHQAELDVARIKTLLYGGAPMYLADLKRAMEVFGPRLWQGYGQGETPNTISCVSKAWHAAVDHPHYERILSSVGLPRTGVEVNVVDERGMPMPAGETGEVVVRSEVTMSGYWNNPQATQQALRNGWLFTGDLGSLDELGFLTLRDRSKDVIISGGSNIYPREVEEVLLRHHSVLEVAVVGRPSQEWGEEVCAFVVLRPGEKLASHELDALCTSSIARFKRPKSYRLIDSLPKSSYGKILKKDLRALLLDEVNAGPTG